MFSFALPYFSFFFWTIRIIVSYFLSFYLSICQSKHLSFSLLSFFVSYIPLLFPFVSLLKISRERKQWDSVSASLQPNTFLRPHLLPFRLSTRNQRKSDALRQKRRDNIRTRSPLQPNTSLGPPLLSLRLPTRNQQRKDALRQKLRDDIRSRPPLQPKIFFRPHLTSTQTRKTAIYTSLIVLSIQQIHNARKESERKKAKQHVRVT